VKDINKKMNIVKFHMKLEKLSKKNNKLLEFIFYSNYFYGICAVALSVEANLQQHSTLNGSWYYILVFLATVLYYAYPYTRKNLRGQDPRANWYARNYNLMRWNQVIITTVLLISFVVFLSNYSKILLSTSADERLLILVFPMVAALYYGINFFSKKYNIRKIGWLKPFIIGFTWAGFVTVYPVLFYDITNHLHYNLNWISGLLFWKNFMFITILCIMFDIKDYAVDYINRLRTFVVKLGLRKTIFNMIFPLSAMGLGSFVLYAITHQFHLVKILLNVIPFVLMLAVAWSLHKRRSILYYLVIVDGLMLIKAVCGSIAMIYF